MTTFLIIVHVIVSIALIAIVLLQSGKGAEMGASFGAGGSQSVFGAGGGTTFLSKLTTGAAIIFMLTSLTLAYRASLPSTNSIMSSQKAVKPASQKPAMPQQPANTAPATGAPQQTAPAPAAPAQLPAKN
jgi:preprotein translocase subunit SecG